MKNYLRLLTAVLNDGIETQDRTGVGTISHFGGQLSFDLKKGFPLVTTKKIHLKSIIYELLWFLRGDTNIAYLQENGVTIWNEWADGNGNLGRVYGAQWRSWRGFYGQNIDQIKGLIDGIKTNPHSRRHIVSAWNVSEIGEMALPPCHCFFQCYVRNGELSLQLYQRSADLFLGVPFNIASYALLTHIIAQVCDLNVGKLIMSFGDLHIYKNHIEQVTLQITREPVGLPILYINKDIKDIDDFQYSDFEIKGYRSHPPIKGDVAI